jgi:outer membrane lipoprotein-sorting protein
LVRTSKTLAAVLGLIAAVAGVAVAQTKGTVAQTKDTCEFQVRTRSKVGYRGMATYYVKGGWVREEKRSGGGMELILLSNDKGLFIRNKYSKYWFRYPDAMGFNLRERLLGGPVGDVKKFLRSVSAVQTGKEKVDSLLCSVWTYRMKGATDRFRLWIDPQNTKPVRMERDFLVKGTQKRDLLVVEYKRYQAGSNLPDSLFQIGANEKVHDMRQALLHPGKTLRSLRKLAKNRGKDATKGAPVQPQVTHTTEPVKP